MKESILITQKYFYDNLVDLLLERKLSEEGLLQVCFSSGKKLSLVRNYLSTRLKDKGIKLQLVNFLNCMELMIMLRKTRKLRYMN